MGTNREEKSGEEKEAGMPLLCWGGVISVKSGVVSFGMKVKRGYRDG